jgi:integrating conjugative element protein (TIGR03759 family)
MIFLISGGAFADGAGWTFTPGAKDENSDFHDRLPMPFKDDTTEEDEASITLTPPDLQQAKSWGLSEREEKRYVAIMEGKGSGFFRPQMLKTSKGDMIISYDYSPIEVLGIDSRNNEERNQYAAKEAEQEFQWNAKFLAYNSAYSREAKALKEKLNLPVLRSTFSGDASNTSTHSIAFQPHDTLLLFARMEDEVRPITAALMRALQKDPSLSLNVYLVGKTVTQDQIQGWARTQNLLPSLVSDHQITLNLGNHKVEALGKTPLPALVLIRNGESELVDLGRF